MKSTILIWLLIPLTLANALDKESCKKTSLEVRKYLINYYEYHTNFCLLESSSYMQTEAICKSIRKNLDAVKDKPALSAKATKCANEGLLTDQEIYGTSIKCFYAARNWATVSDMLIGWNQWGCNKIKSPLQHPECKRIFIHIKEITVPYGSKDELLNFHLQCENQNNVIDSL